MESTLYLYDTLLGVLAKWAVVDLRHRKTLAWMMVGLICSEDREPRGLGAFFVGRAQYVKVLSPLSPLARQ